MSYIKHTTRPNPSMDYTSYRSLLGKKAWLEDRLNSINSLLAEQERLNLAHEEKLASYRLVYDSNSYIVDGDLAMAVREIKTILDDASASANELRGGIQDVLDRHVFYDPNPSHIYPCPNCGEKDMLSAEPISDSQQCRLKCLKCGWEGRDIDAPEEIWYDLIKQLQDEGYIHEGIPVMTNIQPDCMKVKRTCDESKNS